MFLVLVVFVFGSGGSCSLLVRGLFGVFLEFKGKSKNVEFFLIL